MAKTLEDIQADVVDYGQGQFNEGVLKGDAEGYDRGFKDGVASVEPPPPPPPPTLDTVFGTSRPDLSGSALVPAVRTYLSAGERPTTIAQDSGLVRAFSFAQPEGVVWFSIKELAGQWLASLLSDMFFRHPDIGVVVTADHEPVNEWFLNNRVPEWHSRQQEFENVLASFPEVTGVTVMEGSHFDTPGYYEAMYRPNQGSGIDSYNPGIQTPKAYVDPAEVHGPRFALLQSMNGGEPVFVGETGTGPVKGRPASERTDWTRANHSYLAGETADQAKVAVACNWNGGPGKTLLSASDLDIFING